MKSVITHGVLAVAGLGFAYQTWTRPPENEEAPAPGQTVVLECARDAISQIEYEAQTHISVYRPEKAKDGIRYWITTTHKPAEKKDEKAGAGGSAAAGTGGTGGAGGAGGAGGSAAPADATASKGTAGSGAAGSAAPDAAKPEDDANKPARAYDPHAPFTFAASPKLDDLLNWLSPLRAGRSLGKLPKDKFKEFGFEDVNTFVRIDCGGKKLALDIGGRTYGAGDRYARDPKTGEVYLIDGAKLQEMQSAQFKFMQSTLHNFTLDDVDEMTINAAGKQRKLLHRNRKNKEQSTWVDAAAPDKRNELYGNWLQRLAGLKARSYLGEGKEPGADLQIDALGSEPVMTIDYKVEGKPNAKLELVRVDTKKGGMYYARSEATHRWVALFESSAKQVEDDLRLVVGADEAASDGASESSEPAAGSPAQPAAPPAGKPAAAPAAPSPALPPGHPPTN